VASGRDGFIVMILRALKMVVFMRVLDRRSAQYGPPVGPGSGCSQTLRDSARCGRTLVR